MTKTELLRRLQPGTMLRLVHRSFGDSTDRRREVVRATGRSAYFKSLDSQHLTRITPSEYETVIETPNGFELHWQQRADGVNLEPRMMRYEWGI